MRALVVCSPVTCFTLYHILICVLLEPAVHGAYRPECRVDKDCLTKIENGACISSARFCKRGKCGCSTGFQLIQFTSVASKIGRVKRCVPIRKAGEKCDPRGKQSDVNGIEKSDHCQGNTVCRDGKCQCPVGTSLAKDGSTCKSLKHRELGERCQRNADCFSRTAYLASPTRRGMSEHPALLCIKSKCMCAAGYEVVKLGGAPKCRVIDVGASCAADDDCNVVQGKCSAGGKCQCGPDRKSARYTVSTNNTYGVCLNVKARSRVGVGGGCNTGTGSWQGASAVLCADGLICIACVDWGHSFRCIDPENASGQTSSASIIDKSITTILSSYLVVLAIHSFLSHNLAVFSL